MRCMPQKRCVRVKKLSQKEVRDLDVKIGFLEGILRRDENYVEAPQILGDHYTRRGKIQEGLKVDQKLSQLEPCSPLVFYNLACSYSLNHEFEEAVAALDKAMALGYRDFKWLARDPDLRPLREHPLYRGVQDKIRKLTIPLP